MAVSRITTLRTLVSPVSIRLLTAIVTENSTEVNPWRIQKQLKSVTDKAWVAGCGTGLQRVKSAQQ